MKLFLRNLSLKVARALGSQIIDSVTGRPLGRALLIAWRGKVHVIGLETSVRPVFLPQKTLTYWKQELAFTAPFALDESAAMEEAGKPDVPE